MNFFDAAPLDRVGERDVGAGDRRGAGAAVGLQHVAVDHDRVLAERLGVDDGAERTADEPRDLVRAPADPALDALAVVAAVGRARQHGVLGRDPSLALAGQPARHAARERRGAEHLRAAERDERRALGVRAPASLDRDGAQLVGGAAVGAGDVGHGSPQVGMPSTRALCGRWMAPVCTSWTSRTSRPIRRCARRRKSSADAPVAS